MNWTDERVELLKKLWSEGLSASQIAAQLGGVSRNAVIGKVHRLKLSGRGKTTTAAPRSKKPAPAPVAAPRSTTTAGTSSSAASGISSGIHTGGASANHATMRATMMKSSGAAAAALQPEAMSDAVVAPIIRNNDNVVVPISRHLTLLQLTERTCKWPVGDPLHDDFHFCGHESGESTPYCAYHSKLAFQPTSERRRAR
ncbi:GcrA family cell cycle regulator [Pseudochrobactrum sp. MP213Fo]|uniref:GcrA family cell cycle regulator n=1 Tax=Pseudochrobactrum sp. MP213Fo TaxID=3022250 RepID=UPI003BA30625